MSILPLKTGFSDIPRPVKVFVIKAVSLLILWSLLSHFIFEPYRVPHRWLTNTTAYLSVDMLNLFYQKGFSVITTAGSAEILLGNRHKLYILDGCNAFSLYALYIGVMVCIPTSIKRVAIFSVVGIATIFILNIFRCVALTWLCINYPDWMNFAHHYAFTIIVYAVIFAGWVLYAKVLGKTTIKK